MNNNEFGYENSYVSENEITAKKDNVKNKREKKSVSLGVLAVCLAVCLAVSGTAGYFGGFIAGNILDGYNNSDESGSGAVANSSGVTSKDDIITTSEVTEKTSTIADVVEKTADSVVVITTETVVNNNWYGNYVESGAGSGVIIEKSGYIVTCHHVIESATTVNVTLDNGSKYVAELIGSDKKTDLALLKIDASDLTVAVFGNSDNLRVGEETIVIGNPLGTLGGSVTNGIISALERKVTVDGSQMTLLQTNAEINPGNSGGAMFDKSGLLIGIVNAKNVDTDVEGLGFAIPANTVKTIISDLYEFGYVKGRPSLGISLLEISDSITAMRYGVSYLGVYVLGSSGELKAGDLIVAIDENENVSNLSAIATVLDGYNVGDKVELTVYRNKKYHTVTVSLTEETGSNGFQ